MTLPISIAWRDRPFDGAFHHCTAATGPSIHDIVMPLRDLPAGFAEIGVARLNGDEIPRDLWARVRPKPGTSITLHTPIGDPGRGGGSGKNTIALVATIAVLLTAAAVSGGALGPQGLAIAGGLFAGGSVSAAVAGAGIGADGILHVGRTFNV
jgi:hypothetical protein